MINKIIVSVISTLFVFGVEAAPVVVARPVTVRPPVVSSKPIVVNPIGKVEQKSSTATSKPAYVPFAPGSGLVKNDDGKKPASSAQATQSFFLPNDFFSFVVWLTAIQTFLGLQNDTKN